MHIPSIISAALAFTSSVSSSEDEPLNCASAPFSRRCRSPELSHLWSVCDPVDANAGVNGSLYLSLPCVQRDILAWQCAFGRTFNEVWNMTGGSLVEDLFNWTAQSAHNQRLCACESHFFDTVMGCDDCFLAHGADPLMVPRASRVESVSSAYCAATNTPTDGVIGLLFGLALGGSPQGKKLSSSVRAEAKTSPYSDPLSGKTAASLYYTPAVTGTAIFNIAGVTHGATPTATNIVNGHITSGASVVDDGMAAVKVALVAILALVVSIAAF